MVGKGQGRTAGEIVPAERRDSLRRAIAALLEGGTYSARDISGMMKIPEKSVAEHLEHIRRSLSPRGLALEVIPAECRDCGFVFKKRERLTKPGRCPLCRGSAIDQPLYSITGRGNKAGK